MKLDTNELLAYVNSCPLDIGDMRPYQIKEAVGYLLDNPRSALYADMGLGKTVTVLTLLDILFWRWQLRRALIVGPLRVMVQTWPSEIGVWRHLAWMRDYKLIRPDPTAGEVTSAMMKARAADPLSAGVAARKAKIAVQQQQMRRASRSEFPIHFINREQLDFLVQYWKASTDKWPYDCIIFDESTSFADHTSKRWAAAAWACRRSRRVHLLSGTPAPEGIADLFAQIYLLDGGKRFGRSITRFRNTFMDHNPYSKKFTAKEGAAEQVAGMCADICKVMKEADYLPRDEPLVFQRPVVLDREQLNRYRTFEDEAILELPDGDAIEAVNAGVLSGKLLQYASGSVYGTDKSVHELHTYKIEELAQIRDELPGEPLMVAYWFKSSLDKLKVAFPHATVMDKDGACVEAWNAGKIPMLFVHPQSAGHGLNMQKGPGHILVFFDTPASLELYLQIRKRLDRSGQNKIVKIIHIVTKGTLDELCVPRLIAKEDVQDEIVRYLRARRKSLPGKSARDPVRDRAASICEQRIATIGPDGCGGGSIGYYAIGEPGGCPECMAEAQRQVDEDDL